MKKSSIYLTESNIEQIRRLAKQKGSSQSEIVRAAIAAYEAGTQDDRRFSLAGAWEGNGTSISEISEEEALEGFGS